MDITKQINAALNYRNNGDLENAEKIYLDILRKYPQNTVILPFLGAVYYEMHKFELAVKYLRQAFENKPNNAVIKMLAISYYYLGNVIEGEYFLKLCTKFDKTPEIYNKLINSLISNNYGYGEAYGYSRELYKKYPFDVENIVNLSEICFNIGKFNDSTALCRKALSICPNYPKAWIQKGILEEVLNYNDDEARKCFRKALKLGDKENAYHNLCINYSHSDYKKSNYYGKALIKLKGKDVHNGVIFTIGSNYLAMRKMKQGYKYYIHRWDGASENEYPYVKIIKDAWQGEIHKNGTLFILCDLGFGDKIMFIRYLPFAAKKFKRVIVMCDEVVLELFKRSFRHIKNVEFIPFSDNYPVHDRHIPATHLPDALNMDFYHIPASCGYLIPDMTKVEEYKKKYFNVNKLKAGLCWEAGSCELRRLHNRSIMFSDLKKLLSLQDKIRFYSFQLRAVSVSRKTVRSSGIVDLSECIKDFDDTAALLKNIDVLITVDTSVAHLAGALGIKTFLFLPQFSEWRWFDNTDKTEWYDSVKIFKQSQKKSCTVEINEIYDNLLKMSD